ncbi:Hypothetical protein, putative [Bodo saltans]|uniref:Uncharacterized protein n=1 Tax=Bodo saltans TaxID=75058 RepID=A0A0S4IRP8_BODSA|nr:Hypothetical protein, putative [Bodo saltans]|eukprot:CUE74668.1 Hypothetical protein, putative [Bodo saltans]
MEAKSSTTPEAADDCSPPQPPSPTLSSSVALTSAAATLQPLSRRLSFDVFTGSVKVVPKVGGFGKKITGLGAAPHLRHTPLASASSGIRILGIYCADDYFRFHGEPRRRKAQTIDAKRETREREEEAAELPSTSPPTIKTEDDSAKRSDKGDETSCGVSSSSSLSSTTRSKEGGWDHDETTTKKRAREETSASLTLREAKVKHDTDATEEDVRLSNAMHPSSSTASPPPPPLVAGEVTQIPPRHNIPSGWRRDAVGARRVYVRFLVDKTLEATLPLEVMRERYPEVLMDYLLSTAAFV